MRLCLVHGFTQTGASWGPVADLLRTEGHQVLTPDLPGHGTRSTVSTDLPGAARLLAEDVGPATWVGYSMGGRLALHVALLRPDVTDGLVLVSTTAGIEDEDARRSRREADEALAADVERLGVAAFVDRWLEGPLWSTLPPARAGIAHRLTNTPAGLASSLRRAGTGAQEPLWDRLPEIAAPALVVTGALDTRFTTLGERLAASIRGADRTVIPRAGHALPWEQPDAFATAVHTWLSQSRSRR